MRDILTDPDFWTAVGNGETEKYLKDRTGLDLKDLWTALWEAFISGQITDFHPKPGQATNDNWNNSKNPPRKDPLAIDLDGDGIETVGLPTAANPFNPVLFDHNADGVRTGTGWVRPDDAWLALDRNGNGTIDSGRELFGVDTLVQVTQTIPMGGQMVTNTYTRNAFNGFEALSTLDANGDKVFNSADAQFANVRLWQDTNQDGISQASELKTLAQQGITAINLTPDNSNINLGNGNTVTGQAAVTRTNGSTTTVGGVGIGTQASNLNLADNPFYRQFPDTIPLTAAAKALPGMGGYMRNRVNLYAANLASYKLPSAWC